jgi:hypothetical protein
MKTTKDGEKVPGKVYEIALTQRKGSFRALPTCRGGAQLRDSLFDYVPAIAIVPALGE